METPKKLSSINNVKSKWALNNVDDASGDGREKVDNICSWWWYSYGCGHFEEVVEAEIYIKVEKVTTYDEIDCENAGVNESKVLASGVPMWIRVVYRSISIFYWRECNMKSGSCE